jgi:hypothetical protein
VAAAVVATEMVVAGLVAEVVGAEVVTAAWVVAAGVVVVAVVGVVDVLVPLQALIMKVQIKRIASGINTFFILPSLLEVFLGLWVSLIYYS